MKATMGYPERMLRSSVVTVKKSRDCWFCDVLITPGEKAVSFAAIDQQGGFTYGYHHNHGCMYEELTWLS